MGLSMESHTSVYPTITIEQYQETAFVNMIDNDASMNERCCSAPTSERLNNIAKVEQHILFSGQDGSWMFQSFVNNGLFKIASAYQPQHPRALLIKNGQLTLDQLYKLVDDKTIMDRQGARYQLFFPIIIEPSAALIIDGHLEMSSKAGAAIINRGQLFISEGFVTASDGGSSGFRSFIVSWNGSYTSITNSQLINLGYNGYLSQGLTLTAHEKSLVREPAILNAENSVFEGSFVGVSSHFGEVFLHNNQFKAIQSDAIDLRKSKVVLSKNTIIDTSNGHGIRLVDNIFQKVTKNTVKNSNKSGLVVSGQSGVTEVLGNQLQENGENGLWIDQIQTQQLSTFIIKGNIVANNQLSGIKTNCLHLCLFVSNLMIGNKRYGFSLENITHNHHQLILQGNYFKLNTLASIKTLGFDTLILSNNKFYFDYLQSTVFVGDLEPHQSFIQKSLVDNRQGITIKNVAVH